VTDRHAVPCIFACETCELTACGCFLGPARQEGLRAADEIRRKKAPSNAATKKKQQQQQQQQATTSASSQKASAAKPSVAATDAAGAASFGKIMDMNEQLLADLEVARVSAATKALSPSRVRCNLPLCPPLAQELCCCCPHSPSESTPSRNNC